MKHIKYISIFLFIIITNSFYNTNCYSQVNNEYTNKFDRAFDFINNYYVDTTNKNDLIETAITEMLKKLDPHSIYIGLDEVKSMNEPLEGSFCGIGIEYFIMNDTLMVLTPIPGGPSEKLGIMAGDKIVQIDGANVASIGLKNSDVTKRLRGEKGTTVNLMIKRRDSKKLLDYTIERNTIPIFSIDASYMVDKTIGYIRLNKFSATSMDEFKKAVEKLRKDGMKNLILDLQDNTGGYLNVSVELADQFLDDNRMIVYTEGVKDAKREYKTTSKGIFRDGELVVLVDENSASASEILSGAIQDWDRGVIIGRRTFGKGLVQRPFTLPDGSMIRLTIARYYTPTGRLIQKPYKSNDKDYSKDIINRYNNGELTKADTTHFPDSLKKATMITKRMVYGGGGIMPDIFVPMDTSFYSEWYRQLNRKNTIYKYVIAYVDINRKSLIKKYPDFKSFNDNFIVTGTMTQDLLKDADRDKVKMVEKDYNTSIDYIRNLIKAYIAGELFTNSEKAQVLNSRSNEFLKAIEVLNDKSLYNKKLNLK